jgi:hypothetical protein
MGTLVPEMGNLRSLKREPSRARSCSLWCQTSHSLVTDCCHNWSENGHPCVARTLWSWDLATPGSERASSRLDLAPSESSLLQCQKFRSRGYICAPPELGLTSLGLEVAFFRLKVSCSIIFFAFYPVPVSFPLARSFTIPFNGPVSHVTSPPISFHTQGP